ncbi:MAG: prepilin-type N-terminal cleavage/methylation domain-containing protein [Candidatus Brocadia sp.]|nr:prepilin-type N-terminal cleavage/methylation domain-containing protein [Candidatus Brocadia sp.]
MRREQGFTLFELLIAIFIGTILVMSGAYAIRIGLFSMEREEAWFNDSTREKAAYDFFWQQTSSLRVQKVPSKDLLEAEGSKMPKKKKPIYFIGEKDFLTFVSPLSFAKHYGQGLIIANYKVKINDNGLWDLIYSEFRASPTTLIKLSEELEGRLSTDRDRTVFLKDCDMISFAYLDELDEKNDNEGDVGEEDIMAGKEDIHGRFQDADVIEGTDLKWKEKMKEKVPLAVKLFVSKQGKEQELISPIMVTYSFLASGQ